MTGDALTGEATTGEATTGDAMTDGVMTERQVSELPVTDRAQPVPRPMKRTSPWRWVVRVALGIVVLGLAYYAVSLWQVWSTGRSDQARPVDAIVVMGAAQYDGTPSPQLAARLDHVVELWPRDLAPMVFVTGGKQPGDRFTEAESSAAYLVERGVPESAIVLENSGASTIESLEEVERLLRSDAAADAETLDDDEPTVLIVTDPYHALRSRLIAEEQGLTAYVSPAERSVVTGARALRRNLLEAGGVAVGRLVGFDRL